MGLAERDYAAGERVVLSKEGQRSLHFALAKDFKGGDEWLWPRDMATWRLDVAQLVEHGWRLTADAQPTCRHCDAWWPHLHTDAEIAASRAQPTKDP